MFYDSSRFAGLLAAAAVCLLAIAIPGCSSSTTDTNNNNNNNGTPAFTIVINGAGMSNRSLAFGSPAVLSTGGSVSTYSTGNDATGIAISGGAYKVDGKDVTAVVTFPGKSTGSFPYPGDQVAVGLTIGSTGSGEFFSTGNSAGTVLVSEYSAVGGKVKGTFSGSMMYLKGITPPVTVNVSGTFEAVRLADGQ